jgi:hypothetical protein
MIEGKTIFSWNVPEIFKGDPKAFAEALVNAGFEGVLLKSGNGNAIFRMSTNGPWPKWGENIKKELVDALRAAGLKVYFWHFVYGVDIKGELAIADHQCTEFGPDEYVWDVETSFDEQKNAEANARLLTTGLEKAHPNIPQALCWWALPKNPKNHNQEWHPIRVAHAFMDVVDCVMPMMYWGGRTITDALLYLDWSLSIWKEFNSKPIIPVGRAYTGDGGYMDATAITAFAKTLKERSATWNLPGVSWWVLDQVMRNPECWSAMAATPKYKNVVPPKPAELSMEEIINRLVKDHRTLFPELFNN